MVYSTEIGCSVSEVAGDGSYPLFHAGVGLGHVALVRCHRF